MLRRLLEIEAGLTLVELLVAMVLLVVVGGGITVALIDGADKHKDSLQQRKLATGVTTAVNQLKSDLSKAQAPARFSLTADDMIPSIETTKGGTDDARDIIAATPWMIRFRAQAANEPQAVTDPRPSQCVTWLIDSGWLTRIVQSGVSAGGNRGWQTTGATASSSVGQKNCYGAVLSNERMMPLPQYANYRSGSAAPAPAGATQCARSDQASATTCLQQRYAPIFSYTEQVNDDLVGATNPENCTTVNHAANDPVNGRYYNYNVLPGMGDSSIPASIPGYYTGGAPGYYSTPPTPAMWVNSGPTFTRSTTYQQYTYYYYTRNAWSYLAGPYSGGSTYDGPSNERATYPYPQYVVVAQNYNGNYIDQYWNSYGDSSSYYIGQDKYWWWNGWNSRNWYGQYQNQSLSGWRGNIWGSETWYYRGYNMIFQPRAWQPANPGVWVPAVAPTWVPPTPGGRIAPLNRITTVNVDLRSRFDPRNPPRTASGEVLSQSHFASSSMRMTVGIRSRSSQTYLRALGCAS